ncbi:MAG: restriction endonuclease [Actinomycetota bacterium]|nr:restriction endonuclease [Actinomycetota bacterium]
MAVWVVKGGRHGEFEDTFLTEGLIGKGGKLPDLSSVSSREELRRMFEVAYPDAQTSQVANHVGQFWSLLKSMDQGELVVLPLKTTHNVAVGRIDGPYQYREDLVDTLHHVRPVWWINTEVPRDAFDQDLLYSFGALITIGRVNREHAEQRILAAFEQGPQPAPAPPGGGGQGSDGSAEETPDVEAVARDQIRLFISANFAGHDLARLVGAILQAQGFAVTLSPPGADQGVDILAGHGALGLDSPRVVVQVKTGQAGIEEFRSLRGLVTALAADQGLLVAWRGFKGTVRTEAKQDYFKMRLWDAEDLLSALLSVYEKLGEDVRSELPLQRVWALVPSVE